MKERPILFSAPMIRALLDGSKTQTRRVAKPQPSRHHWEGIPGYALNMDGPAPMEGGSVGVRFNHTIPQNREWDRDAWVKCPYGQPGDRLWVREAWMPVEHDVQPYRYRATNPSYIGKWKPSIHMPRIASRITLDVVSVRVERLRDISRGDAMGEGCPFPNMAQGDDPRQWYADLWSQINGPGSWELNPWVWVVEFKRIAP